jgi:hypothetical protein
VKVLANAQVDFREARGTIQMEEKDLIYAKEVRALVRGLAMEREVVSGGNFHF